MQSDEHSEPVSPEALKRKHESRNPAIGRILFIGALVLLMMVTCLWISWLIMGGFARSTPLDQTAESRGVITAPDLQTLNRFPGPSLQVNPREDLLVLRARDEAQLSSYGWVDRDAGVVRIPIERAMDLILERGLPVQETNAPPATGKSSLELIRERSQQR